MKQSIKKKTFISIAAIVLIALVVGLCICFAFSNRFYISVKQRSLKNVYSYVNSLYNDSGKTSLSDEGYTKLSVLCEENTVSMLVITESGVIDFAFGNSAALYRRLNDIILSRDDEQSNTRIIEENEHYSLQSHNRNVRSEGYVEIWGILDNRDLIIARSSYAGITNAVRVSLMFFGIVCAIIFIFTAILVFFIVKPYTDSLNRLLVYAQKANKGEFEVQYQGDRYFRNDEIGMIGSNINEMSHKLEKAISELKTTNLRLENELKGRIAQDEARKKYMSDVSHELKTPIALISGYAEGIKEGISDSPEERDYYCDVIIDEAEKMSVMIKKLATLNQLEHGGGNELNLERFNVVDVIDGFLNNMAIVIEEKGANIYFNNTASVYVWSDEFLFEEALMNFFNNAINHMDEKKIIRINAEYFNDTTVRVTVFNSGNYIAEEEQDRIWEQFYKIDKARTREYGGSGLGLSIVKAIADTLGKECGVVNVDDGVAFWIDLEGVERPKEEEVHQESAGSKVIHRMTELPIWKNTKNVLDRRRNKEQNGSDQ